MKDKKNLIFLLLAELICFSITRIYVFAFQNDAIYISGMNIVQSLYFLPIFLISLYFFISTKTNKTLIIHSTIGFIFYTIIMHFGIAPISSFFTDTQGMINFTNYASKIYFICLPLAGFQIWGIKEKAMRKSCFLLIFKILLLFLITLIFDQFFALKGVLYAWPLSELIYTLIFIRKYKKTGI